MVAMRRHGGGIPMITLEECAEFAALETSELFTGAVLSARHRSLLSSYLFNLHHGPVAVRKMIVWDIRAAIDLGASKYAADLVLVLRLFLSKYPEVRIHYIFGKEPATYGARRIDFEYRPTARSVSEANCWRAM
jgi:hypothetical protein